MSSSAVSWAPSFSRCVHLPGVGPVLAMITRFSSRFFPALVWYKYSRASSDNACLPSAPQNYLTSSFSKTPVLTNGAIFTLEVSALCVELYVPNDATGTMSARFLGSGRGGRACASPLQYNLNSTLHASAGSRMLKTLRRALLIFPPPPFQLIPPFGLYRGLYEFSEAALQGDAINRNGVGAGMQPSDLEDPQNGLKTMFGIFVVEWFVILLMALYFDKIIPSGAP